MKIETELTDLVLSSFSPDQAGRYSEYASNINIWNLFRDEFPNPYTVDDALTYFKNVKDSKTHFAILYKGNLIGDVHLGIQTDILRKSAMLGYWLAEPFWGRGFMTCCIKAITDYGFTVLNLHRIFARVFAVNRGSERALEKSGFEKEGEFKDAVYKNGVFMDQLQYAKLAPERKGQ